MHEALENEQKQYIVFCFNNLVKTIYCPLRETITLQNYCLTGKSDLSAESNTKSTVGLSLYPLWLQNHLLCLIIIPLKQNKFIMINVITRNTKGIINNLLLLVICCQWSLNCGELRNKLQKCTNISSVSIKFYTSVSSCDNAYKVFILIIRYVKGKL